MEKNPTQTLQCPICGQLGLQQAFRRNLGRHRVICQNEYVTHARAHGVDYLVRVPRFQRALVLN